MRAPISLVGVAVHPDCWCICLCYLHFAPENPEDGEMYLLCVLLTYLLSYRGHRPLQGRGIMANKSYGMMRHVCSCKNTRDTPSASAAEAAECCYAAPSASAADHLTAARSRRVDSGSRQTLLVLQFVIDLLIFGHNTVHRHTHRLTSAFFDLCPNVQMAGVTCWK